MIYSIFCKVFRLGKLTEGLITVYYKNDEYGLHLDDYRYFMGLDPNTHVQSLNLEVSIFYYANPNWTPDQGGRLELHYYDFEKDTLGTKK